MLAKKLAVVPVGLPGAGKDSIVGRTIETIDGYHIGTGEYFREIAPEITKTGQLVPDNLVNEFIAKKIVDSHSATVILNGYPRNEDQARVAFRMLTGLGYRILLIELQIPEEVSIERQLNRYQKAKEKSLTDPSIKVRPEDGDLDVVTFRTHSQHEKIQDVLHFMIGKRVEFVRLMATRPLEEVEGSFLRTVLATQRGLGLRSEHLETRDRGFRLDQFVAST